MANFKRIIDNLQKIDFKDIKLDADLSKIDMQQVQDNLMKRKDLLFNIALVIVTLVVINVIFSNRKHASQNANLEIQNLEEKTNVIQAYEKQKETLEKIIESSPKGFKSPTAIINAISEIAQSLNVKIISFEPKKLEVFDEYTLQAVEFSFSGKFQDILRLVNKIENHKRNFRIDIWSRQKSIQNLFNPLQNAIESKDDTIICLMLITSIDLKK